VVRIIQTADLDPHVSLPRTTNDWVYNGLDCCVTLEICHTLLEQLDDTSRTIYERSLALQGPVLEMTLRGIKINEVERKQILAHTVRDIMKLEANLYMILQEGLGIDTKMKGPTKYWRSNKQLMHLFYTVLGLEPIKKRNAAGGFSPTVEETALEKLSIHFYAEPICAHILLLRDLDKQRQLLETELDEDKHLRASWNIAGTNSGRFSCSESAFGTGRNTQNIDKRLRTMFIADDGMKLANLDLKQADARNLGAICWELFVEKYGPEFAGKYLDYCESGDLHTKVCEMGWPTLPWTGNTAADRAIADVIAHKGMSYRDLSKRLGHGTNYQGEVSVAQATKLAMSVILAFKKKYFAGFPCIELWHDWVRRQLIDFGFITTLLGRRRFFYGRPRDANNIREAVAYGPQSMTAEQTHMGLVNLFRTNRVQLLLEGHDALIFQYPKDEEEEILPLAIAAMTIPLTLKQGREFVVPVDAKVGWNWGDKTSDNYHGLAKWKGAPDERTSPVYGKQPRLSFLRELER